jgi:hypothetical protein
MDNDLIQIAAGELGRSAPIIGFLWFYLREMRHEVTDKIAQLTADVSALKIQVASQGTDLKLSHHKELIEELKADISALKLKFMKNKEED